MSFTLRRVGGTAVLAVAASALTLPLAPMASAAPIPVERVWTLADSDGNGTYGLYADNVPGGPPTKVDETATASFSDLAASRDGSRLVYVRDTDSREQIVVRDIGGQIVRTIVDLPITGSTVVFEPQLSPNGNTVSWTQLTFGTSFSVSVKKAAVSGGSVSTVAADHSLLAFLDNSTVLVQSNTGTVQSVPVTGGTPAATSGLSLDTDQVSLSADGTRIAWAEDTSPASGNSTEAVHVGTLTKVGATWTVTGNTTLSSALDNEQPAFSRDGATVYWVQYDGGSGPGEVLARPFDASTGATTLAVTPDDEIDVAVTALPSADVTAPGSAIDASSYTLAGTSATIKWTLPGDADLSGVLISRPGKTNAFVPAPLTSYVDTGLTIGTTYT
ncbi:MAG: hypothetical protein M3P04_09690, partial [Actinomycetota bacterium]|nr:hypothetical protein [Actinomycetota bacterium]